VWKIVKVFERYYLLALDIASATASFIPFEVDVAPDIAFTSVFCAEIIAGIRVRVTMVIYALESVYCVTLMAVILFERKVTSTVSEPRGIL
jgi:hypothetical protein